MIPKRGAATGVTERRPRACYKLSGWQRKYFVTSSNTTTAKGNGKTILSRCAHPGAFNIQNNTSLTAMEFFLQAAIADINIDKSRSVYYWLN